MKNILRRLFEPVRRTLQRWEDSIKARQDIKERLSKTKAILRKQEAEAIIDAQERAADAMRQAKVKAEEERAKADIAAVQDIGFRQRFRVWRQHRGVIRTQVHAANMKAESDKTEARIKAEHQKALEKTAMAITDQDTRFRSWGISNLFITLVVVAVIAAEIYYAFRGAQFGTSQFFGFSIFQGLGPMEEKLIGGTFVFIVLLILSAFIGPQAKPRKIIEGFKAVLYLWGKRIPWIIIGPGPLLWPGTMIEVSLNTQVTTIPLPREQRSGEPLTEAEIEDAKGFPVVIQLLTPSKDGKKIAVQGKQGNFRVKIRINWNPFDPRRVARYLELGEKDEKITWDGEQVEYKTEIESVFVIGEIMQELRFYFAQLNYFIDICGMSEEDSLDPVKRDKAKPQTVLAEKKKLEIIKLINDKMMGSCGVEAVDVHIERVIPDDDDTRMAVSGAAGEIGQKVKERTDAETVKEVMKSFGVDLTNVTGGMDEAAQLAYIQTLISQDKKEEAMKLIEARAKVQVAREYAGIVPQLMAALPQLIAALSDRFGPGSKPAAPGPVVNTSSPPPANPGGGTPTP